MQIHRCLVIRVLAFTCVLILFRAGSIYFKKDVPAELQAALYTADAKEGNEDSETFCIGPTADYMFWWRKRAGLDIRRGPCEFST